MPTVLLTEAIHEDGVARLKARTGVEVILGSGLAREAMLAAIARADAIGVRTYALPADVLAGANALKVVAKHGVGCDNIAVDHMTGRGLPVAVTAHANKVSVAEHTFAMMLAIAKDTAGYDEAVRQGNWGRRLSLRAFELQGRTLLIIGFGRIGKEVAARARAFGMRVLVADIAMDHDTAARLGCEEVADFRSVLPEVDVLTIHTPKTDLTSGMIGARELAAMKPGAVLINCARGGLVDETALLAALSSGKLLGAGLDVFDDEPLGRDNPFLKLHNVILSPHSAGSTRESGRRMGIETAENILAALDGTLTDENIFNLDALRAAGHR